MQKYKLSFKGQNIFVGIDVHGKTWHVVSITESGYKFSFGQRSDVSIVVFFNGCYSLEGISTVRNVPNLAPQGVSTTFYTSSIIRRGPVLLYSHLASKVRYISHLGHTPNIAEPHGFKQGAVHCLATT